MLVPHSAHPDPDPDPDPDPVLSSLFSLALQTLPAPALPMWDLQTKKHRWLYQLKNTNHNVWQTTQPDDWRNRQRAVFDCLTSISEK